MPSYFESSSVFDADTIFEGHKCPLVHPTTSLCVESLLELVRSNDYSMSLTNVAQNLPSMEN